MKKATLTRTAIVVQETYEVVDNTTMSPISDIADNSGSELVEMLKTYTNRTTRRSIVKLAKKQTTATSPMLATEHQTQIAELSKPAFTASKDGKFDEALNYVISEWDSIKFCVVNGLPLYLLGAVQIGKTIIYNAIAKLALTGFDKSDGSFEPPLVDLVLITTNNLTSSGKQNRDRSDEYLNVRASGNIPVRSILSFDPTDTVQPGTVVQALTNKYQIEKFKSLIEKSSLKDKTHQDATGQTFSPWRVLVLHDEADQANANIADNVGAQKKQAGHSLTEKNLRDLLHEIDSSLINISYAGISATMLSTLAIYGSFGEHRYGELRSEQIISVPVRKDYKGFVTTDATKNITYNPNFARPGLEYEDPQYFKSGKYVASVRAGDGKVKNPKFIAGKMIDHWSVNNPYQLPQIATVNLTKDTKGHKRSGELIAGELNLFKSGHAQFIDGSSTAINVTRPYVVITHNGDPDASAGGFSAPEKIEKIYESAECNGVELRGIVIVGGWLVGRAISFGTKKYNFAYCNLSFTLPSLTVDREALIQSARCSGCYPDVKEHVFYTHQDTIDLIEQYISILYSDFIPNLRTQHVMTQPVVSDYITKFTVAAGNQTKTVKANTGTARVNTHLDVTSSSSARATAINGVAIDQQERDDYIQNGMLVSGVPRQVVPADYAVLLSKTEYNQLIVNDTNNIKMRAFLQSKGITQLPIAKFGAIRNDQKNKDLKPNGNLTANAMRSSFYRTPYSTTVWKSYDGNHWLYYWVGQPTGFNEFGISYDFDMDAGSNTAFLTHYSTLARPATPLVNGKTPGTLVLPS